MVYLLQVKKRGGFTIKLYKWQEEVFADKSSVIEVKGARRTGKTELGNHLSLRDEVVVRYFKYSRQKDECFKSAIKKISSLKNHISYTTKDRRIIQYWILNKNDEIERRKIFFLSGTSDSAIRNIYEGVHGYTKKIDTLIFEDMEVSDKKVEKIREHFIKDFNLKQIFIFNSTPLKRKQYVIDLLQVNKSAAEDMKKLMSEERYKEDIKLIGYEEVD